MKTKFALLGLLLAWPSVGLAAGIVTPTVDEALKISRESGRPILAVAGDKT